MFEHFFRLGLSQCYKYIFKKKAENKYLISNVVSFFSNPQVNNDESWCFELIPVFMFSQDRNMF